jgi:hypothetical protein
MIVQAEKGAIPVLKAKQVNDFHSRVGVGFLFCNNTYMTEPVIQRRSIATRQITGSVHYICHAVSELVKGAR